MKKFFSALVVLLGFTACAPRSATLPKNVLVVGGGRIQVDVDADVAPPRPEIMEWVRRGAVAVSGYLGHFPAKQLLVTVHNGGDESIGGGVTYGDERIEVDVGRSATVSDFNHDWVITHEMFHLAFPTLNHRYLWMNEGLSDYLEPIARARAGQTSAADAWREFVEGLPQGLPGRHARGLDDSFTRERIYWGGNLFWLLADVRIRVKTNNHRSVDDVVRTILAKGGTGEVNWPLQTVLTVGDQATGTTVLEDLHEEIGLKPGHVDLDELWQKLGVKYNNGDITFDDSAPWAAVRQAICRPSGR